MRCKACDIKLDDIDLKKKDNDLCSNCVFLSNQEFTIEDREYCHSSITGVPLDGSPISVERFYRDDPYSE